jgi:DnaJ-class molecular chaperone
MYAPSPTSEDPAEVICRHCAGTGYDRHGETCMHCDGDGTLLV